MSIRGAAVIAKKQRRDLLDTGSFFLNPVTVLKVEITYLRGLLIRPIAN